MDINNRIVCFDIKELGKQLKKIGMLIVQDQVWNRVTINRSAHKSTRYYVDEFHLLLKEEQTAAYSVEIRKQFVISLFAEKDLPEPGVPRISPFGFFRRFRSTIIMFLDNAFNP